VVSSASYANQYAGLRTQGVFRSVDAGVSWAAITGPWSSSPDVGRIELAIARSDSNVVYASVANRFNGMLLGLWKTTDAWANSPSWTQIGTVALGLSSYCHTLCGYSHVLTVDPADPNRLHAGGVYLWTYTGASWGRVTGLHVDQHALEWLGNSLLVGNDGGVYRITGGTPTNLSRGLVITEFHGGALHPTSRSGTLGATQDNAFAARGGSNWRSVVIGPGGDGFRVWYSLTNPDTHWGLVYTSGEIHRTMDGGVTFPDASNGISGLRPPFSPVASCPRGDVALFGTGTLWRSNGFFAAANPAWSPVRAFTGTISAIAFASDTTCGTFAAATYDAQRASVWVTRDGGANWRQVGWQGAQYHEVTRIAFDPRSVDTLYLTTAATFFGPNGRSGSVLSLTGTFAGTAVPRTITPPGPTVAYRALAIDSNDSRILYAGSDTGLWRSADAGNNWQRIGPESGLPYAPIRDVQMNDTLGRLTVFTYGRGAFEQVRPNAPSDLRIGARRIKLPAIRPALGGLSSLPSARPDAVSTPWPCASERHAVGAWRVPARHRNPVQLTPQSARSVVVAHSRADSTLTLSGVIRPADARLLPTAPRPTLRTAAAVDPVFDIAWNLPAVQCDG
jgi:photosystem II stability/assembly factor-like uncharacterized protein